MKIIQTRHLEDFEDNDPKSSKNIAMIAAVVMPEASTMIAKESDAEEKHELREKIIAEERERMAQQMEWEKLVFMNQPTNSQCDNYKPLFTFSIRKESRFAP